MNYRNEQIPLPVLEKQYKTGHYMLLATIIATVVDIALLLGQADLYIPYFAALPYYLTALGFLFDGNTLNTYTATGMVMAFVLLAGWLLVWWMSRTNRKWLMAGMGLVIADTVVLAIFALLFLESPAVCLWPGLLHLAVIYEIHVGNRAAKRMEQMKQQPPANVYDPFQEETPAETEYVSDLDQ